jgi:hypothetical protein
MRITKVSIRRFRSFDTNGVDVTIPDTPHPICIVGQNNSGKSNFVDAILYAVGKFPCYDDTFTEDDFHMRDDSYPFHISVTVSPPLRSPNAFNTITDMPVLKLTASRPEGIGEVAHYCCDANGKPVFNPRSTTRSKTKHYSEEDRAILDAQQRGGAEPVRKYRNHLPVYYIDCVKIDRELKANRWSLLGRLITEIKKEFDDNNCLVEKSETVIEKHIGLSRHDVFDKAMRYLETNVLSTPKFKAFIGNVEKNLRSQLEISEDGFDVQLGPDSADYFFDNLQFFITNHTDKPRLPIGNMGNGFIALFVISVLRAILHDQTEGNIFILEEPETFQHEHFQEYFYRELCSIAQRNQVIYTTHSKKFINLFEPHTILHFRNPDHLHTQVCCDDAQGVDIPESIDGFSISNPHEFGKYLRTLEPNIGNIAFASKVLIVEGAHDVLAYRTVIEPTINLGLRNIAIVAAWGKDTISTLVQLCKKWGIPYFVIHDWDITACDRLEGPADDSNEVYKGLSSEEKAQYTKNCRIDAVAGTANVHCNRLKLETVLKIAKKSAASVFARVNGKTILDVKTDFPGFWPDRLEAFLSEPIKATPSPPMPPSPAKKKAPPSKPAKRQPPSTG